MNRSHRHLWRGHSLVAVAIGATALTANAQDGPARILVGFSAGGSFDAIARLVGEKVKDELHRPIVVDNRPGAGGRLAVDTLKQAPADGSVIMLGPDALASLYPYTLKHISYDPKKDLKPVTTVAEFAFGFATGANPKITKWADFVDWAKKHPKEANYGVPAMGSPHQFFGLLIGEAIGVPMQPVPFQGSAPIAMALMGGQIPATVDVMSSLMENYKAGKINVLAVSSEQRIPQAPDIPTFKELGLPMATGLGFNALYAPAGTPDKEVAKWSDAVAKALAQPDVRKKLLEMGYMPVGKGPEELAARQASSVKRWEPVIKASGYVPQ